MPEPVDSDEELVDASSDEEERPEAPLDEPGREDVLELEEATRTSILD